MSEEPRRESGRYAETVPPGDVLGVFEAVDGPVVTSRDVADRLECSPETARRKLRSLEDDGHVASRETAGRVVWWLVDSRDRPRGVDPDDPFWDFEPGASGERDVSETVDDVLYGNS